jgi:hypothetical protein
MYARKPGKKIRLRNIGELVKSKKWSDMIYRELLKDKRWHDNNTTFIRRSLELFDETTKKKLREIVAITSSYVGSEAADSIMDLDIEHTKTNRFTDETIQTEGL